MLRSLEAKSRMQNRQCHNSNDHHWALEDHEWNLLIEELTIKTRAINGHYACEAQVDACAEQSRSNGHADEVDEKRVVIKRIDFHQNPTNVADAFWCCPSNASSSDHKYAFPRLCSFK